VRLRIYHDLMNLQRPKILGRILVEHSCIPHEGGRETTQIWNRMKAIVVLFMNLTRLVRRRAALIFNQQSSSCLIPLSHVVLQMSLFLPVKFDSLKPRTWQWSLEARPCWSCPMLMCAFGEIHKFPTVFKFRPLRHRHWSHWMRSCSHA